MNFIKIFHSQCAWTASSCKMIVISHVCACVSPVCERLRIVLPGRGDAINRIIVRIQECKRLCCWFTPVSFRRDCCTHEWLRASAESIGLIVCIVCVCVPVYQNGRHGLDIIEMIVRVPNQLINTTVQTTAQTTTSISVNRHGITYYRVNTCQLYARPTQLSPIAWKHAQTQRPSKASFPFWFCRVTDWHVVISITNICRASIAVASNPSGLSQAAVPNMTGLSVRKTRRACEHIVCGGGVHLPCGHTQIIARIGSSFDRRCVCDARDRILYMIA